MTNTGGIAAIHEGDAMYSTRRDFIHVPARRA